MTIDIYEATTTYKAKYDEYDAQIRTAKTLLLGSVDEYIQALKEYFREFIQDEFRVDIRGGYIFLQVEDIDKELITAIRNLSKESVVEFEVNIADNEKTIMIYINSLYTQTTNTEE